jgi:hypothetical protein
MIETMELIPKEMTEPGRWRVNQSKTLKGTNGSPKTFQPRKTIARSAAVSIAAIKSAEATPRKVDTFI